MSVLINKKRCDNADVCSCISECPTHAFYWDRKNETVAVDNDLCINCRACMIACEAGAVKVARTDEEYNKIKKEYDEDAMTINELFKDRFGAGIINEKYDLSLENLDKLINDSDKYLLIEFYNLDESKCLINSILISDIIKKIDTNTSYRKINILDAKKLKKYGITSIPALIIIKNKKIIYKHEGFVNIKDKDKFLNSIIIDNK